jgi:hypothetical protein
MAQTKFYTANSQDGAERDLAKQSRPTISTSLDSVRAYQWEITFAKAGLDKLGDQVKPLTLAAKQVNGIGMSVEDIEVNRVNDKVYYPGRPSMEELVVTFDNLQQTKVDKLLFSYFSSVYNPVTGVLGSGQVTETGAPTAGLQAPFKGTLSILQLDGKGDIRNEIKLFGCYPKNITHGEYNYSTNEFHTLEMTFRYDFFHTSENAGGNIAPL